MDPDLPSGTIGSKASLEDISPGPFEGQLILGTEQLFSVTLLPHDDLSVSLQAQKHSVSQPWAESSETSTQKKSFLSLRLFFLRGRESLLET